MRGYGGESVRTGLPVVIRAVVRRMLLPALVFVGCAFLLMPQAVLGQRTYAAVDMMEPTAPYREGLGRPPNVVSVVQTDQAESLAGPLAFFRALRHGHFQRWDPNVAAGQPTGVLPVNGLLSPFSIGYLFLPAWYAIGFKTFLALVFAQVSTYLLLRRLGACAGAAVVAGVAYTFGGTNLVLIHRVDTVFLLPALFWAVHRLVRQPDRRGAAVVAVLVAWSWFEGFPSGWVYCLYASAAWAAWLAVRRAPGIGAAIRRLALPVVGMAGGVALSAITLVPFLSEVLDRGTLEVRAGAAGNHIPSIQLFGLFDLSATGSPTRGPWWSGLNPVESVSHVGLIVTVAVVLGLLAAALGRLRLSQAAADVWPFFCGLLAIALVVNFLGTPVLTVLEHLPGVARNPIGRSRFLLNLAFAVIGALALDALWHRAPEPRLRASRAAGATALAVLAGAVLFTVVDFARAASSANRLRDVTTRFTVGLVAAALAGALAWAVARRPSGRARAGVTVALAAMLFAQLGWPVRDFTPQAPVGDYYGEQAGHRAVRVLLDGRYRFAATDYQFYPNSGQALGIPDLRGLALHSREFKALVRAFNEQAFSRDPLKIDLKREEWNLASPLLDDLSVRYFALGTNSFPFGRASDEADLFWDRWASLIGIPEDATAGVATGPLNGMNIPMRVGGDCEGGRVTVSVRSGGRLVAETSRAAFDLVDGWQGFALLGQSLTAGDPYSFTAKADKPGCRIDIGMRGPHVARQLLVEDPGAPVRLVSTEQAWIYERPAARQLVTAHSRWRAFADQAQLLAWAASRPPADADVASYVGQDRPAAVAAPAPVVDAFEIAGDTVRAEVRASAPALVVVSQNRAQGWTARIDGKAAPTVAVDGALLGVFVPAGDHVVTLRYMPRSFLIGLAVSGLALLLVVATFVWPGTGRQSRAVSRGSIRTRGSRP